MEAAIKMALQYYFNQDEKRSTFIAFENGFHGDTFGAMSVSSLSVYNGPFEDFLIDVKRIPTPDGVNHDSILEQLKAYAKKERIAGFIYEPIVQGAAGMKIHDTEGLNSILDFCKANQILTIADEVMTGFGKTGKNFASDYIETKPDIIATGCPFCNTMMTDGVKAKEKEAEIAVYDIAELIANAQDL